MRAKSALILLPVLAVLISLVSCTSGLIASTLNPSGVGASPTPAPQLLHTAYYVYGTANLPSPNGLVGYSLVGSTATAISGATYSSPGALHKLAATSNGKFLYGMDQSGPATISAFQIAPMTGAITAAAIPSYTVAGVSSFEGLRRFTVGTNEYLYISDFSGDKIYAYQINVSSGALTAVAGSPFSVVGFAGGICTPADMALTANQQYFYVACQHNGTGAGEAVAGFSVNAVNGALTALAGSPFTATQGGGIYGLVVTPDGTHLFGLSISGSGGLASCPLDMWSIGGSGALSFAPGAPYDSANFHCQFTGQIAPDAKFLYIGITNDGSSTEGVATVPLAATTAIPNGGASSEFSSSGGVFGDTKMSTDGTFFAVSTPAMIHFYSRHPVTGVLTEIGTGSSVAGGGAVEIVKVNY